MQFFSCGMWWFRVSTSPAAFLQIWSSDWPASPHPASLGKVGLGVGWRTWKQFSLIFFCFHLFGSLCSFRTSRIWYIPTLYFGNITKDSSLLQGEDPLGAIHLRGCVVTSVESNPDGKNAFLFEREVPTQTPSPHLGILSLQQSLAQFFRHKHGWISVWKPGRNQELFSPNCCPGFLGLGELEWFCECFE